MDWFLSVLRQLKHSLRGTVWRKWTRHGLLILATLPLLLFLIAPLIALIIHISPAMLLLSIHDNQIMQAINLSLVTTGITTVLAILTGTPVAYLLARRQFPGHTVLDTLIDLPMVLPPSVAGIALLVTFGRRGIFGQYLNDIGIDIAFTQTAVVLAQFFVAVPLYVKAAASGFAAVDREVEQVAAIDGATPLQVFRLITLYLAAPTLFAGAMMTWARALGEFGATIIFAGNFPGRTQTMPLAIYLGFELDLNVAITLAVILLFTSFLILFLVKGLLRQHLKTI